jgi:hypothetical protein
MGGKGKAKSKKTYSRNLACFQCLKLEYAEIFRREKDDSVPELVSFLLVFAAPTITIKAYQPDDTRWPSCYLVSDKLPSCKLSIRQQMYLYPNSIWECLN